MSPRRRTDDTLFDPMPSKTGPGPVYQGVCKQIRTLVDRETVDPEAWAGTIAQARSIARAIDVASGHTGRAQASGMQLAALHAGLDALLVRLTGETQDRDPFDDFLAGMQEGGMTDARDTAPPHAEV